MASGSTQKTRFLPDITERSPVSLQGTRMKTFDRGSAERERIQDEIQLGHSLHQNLCVSMLQEGFHLSFKEFFSLLQRWKADHSATRPDSKLGLRCPLEEQPHKLEMLKEHLTHAETAQRAGDTTARGVTLNSTVIKNTNLFLFYSLGQYVEMYENYLALAKFFSEPDDMWLREHFYHLSLNVARKIEVDSSRREAEANAHLAQLYLEQGDLEEAQEHFEMFYHLAVGQSWQDEGGNTHQIRACEGLCRVYTMLAQRQLQCGDYPAVFKLLNQAYNMAKEAGNRKMEGEAVYRIGLAYQSMSNQTNAKQFLNKFMEISTALQDMEGLAKAHKAIAKSLESEAKISEAIEHLQKYLNICQESKQHELLQDAYLCLGSIYMSRGQYEQSIEYFTPALEMKCHFDSKQGIEKALVCVGIARAHSMLMVYTSNLQNNRASNISALISWKETREEKFHQVLCESAGSTHYSLPNENQMTNTYPTD